MLCSSLHTLLVDIHVHGSTVIGMQPKLSNVCKSKLKIVKESVTRCGQTRQCAIESYTVWEH